MSEEVKVQRQIPPRVLSYFSTSAEAIEWLEEQGYIDFPDRAVWQLQREDEEYAMRTAVLDRYGHAGEARAWFKKTFGFELAEASYDSLSEALDMIARARLLGKKL